MSNYDNLSINIVHNIIQDVHSRYGLDNELRNIHPKVQLKIYEQWNYIVSLELYHNGIIDTPYKPVDVDDLSFAEVIKKLNVYMKK